jgi:hypothetical protein
MAQQQAAGLQPHVGAIRPPREPLSYVLLELFDEQTERVHWFYQSAICGAELGTVRSQARGTTCRFTPAGVRSM